MKRSRLFKASAFQLAVAAILIALIQFISSESSNLQLAAAASSSAETTNAECAADDPTQECANPNSSFSEDPDDDSGDSEDTSEDEEEETEYSDDEPECVDRDPLCKSWSNLGECERNPSYMLENCKISCRSCANYPEINHYGEPQHIPSHRRAEVERIIAKTIQYMKQIKSDEKYKEFIGECRNKDALCSEWAIGTGCDDNPRYMKDFCAPACNSCDHVFDLLEKCRLVDDSSLDAIQPGGMSQLFEQMVNSAERLGFEPKVWSRPLKSYDDDLTNKSEKTSLTCETDITNPCNALDGPWVITLENFISDEEIERLLMWGKTMNYERSQAGDEVSEVRTSAHTWCSGACYEDDIVTLIRKRIKDVTGINEENYEFLQLLKYEVGQFYRAHDDHIEVHNIQSHGPRLLTFFIYFNEVEKGGDTRFPELDLTVHPKKGRVLIWPSIVDDENWSIESRTSHEAMTVEQGQKFAANAWIHMRDFQTPFALGCPG